MKILHVIESLGRGGAERALVNLLPSLKASGHDVTVLALWGPYPLASELEDAGVSVRQLNLSYKWNLIEGGVKFAYFIRRGRYDIIHAHLFFASFYTAMTSPFYKSKRVVSFHNLGYDSYPATTILKKIKKNMGAWLVRNFIDGYIAVSKAVSSHYSKHLGVKDIQVIPNAFPVSKLLPNENLDKNKIRHSFRIPKETFLVVMPSRLVHEKGHRFLLEATQILYEKKLCPFVLFVGSGPLTRKIQFEIEKLGNENIVLMPSMPQFQLLDIIQTADLFVMSSTHEGFPLAPAEAMALEVPVLATRVGGLTDLIEDGVSGILVEPENATALANAIENLISDPTLRLRLATAGRQRIVRKFSTNVVSKHLIEFYKSILN